MYIILMSTMTLAELAMHLHISLKHISSIKQLQIFPC